MFSISWHYSVSTLFHFLFHLGIPHAVNSFRIRGCMAMRPARRSTVRTFATQAFTTRPNPIDCQNTTGYPRTWKTRDSLVSASRMYVRRPRSPEWLNFVRRYKLNCSDEWGQGAIHLRRKSDPIASIRRNRFITQHTIGSAFVSPPTRWVAELRLEIKASDYEHELTPPS